MPLLPILLLGVIMIADAGLRLADPPTWMTMPWRLSFACAPAVILPLVASIGVSWCRRRLDRGRPRALITADRLVRLARMLLLSCYVVAVLAGGWVETVRDLLGGNRVLIDEVIVIAPPLAGLLALWWVSYPMEARVRNSQTIRVLDEGRPVFELPGRFAWVMQLARVHILLLLIPLLVIITGVEILDRVLPVPTEPSPLGWHDLARMMVGLSVFIVAPALARGILTVTTLPDGEVREELTAVCRRHRVRVRDILVWQTGGAMINAAVMGLLGRLRYVLITDALLELLPRHQVLAVMAHEIGHVRRHHMPWLVVVIMAILSLPWLGHSAAVMMGWIPAEVGLTGQTVLLVIQLLLVVILFGWVSRRFERQADTFAVQHLSETLPRFDGEAVDGISLAAAGAMRHALQSIADLNHVERHRRSWRHGSIAWRQTYLTSLIGQPADQLPIDRVVRRVKLAAALVLVISGGLIVWIEFVAGHGSIV